MRFIDNISQLWANRKKADEPCYCDHVVYPNDLILQGQLNTNANTFTVQVFVYSSNGSTQYEDATSYFSFYVALDPNGNKFFNLRCEQFSPAMCTYECYILRVVVTANSTTVFDKFTELYCQNTCCDVPRGISISTDDSTPEVLPDVEPIPYGKCNVPLLRIRSVYECVDNETGYYYGIPTNVIQGTANFSFEVITNLAAKIRLDVAEITVITSFNCNVQRSESFNPYVVEGTSVDAIIPEWKLLELQNQLKASYIEVNDFGMSYGKKRYLYAGGVPAERAYKCWRMFRVKFNLQDCPTRTDFGCGECEVISAQSFLIPNNATGNLFFNENREQLGNYSDLKNYYESLGFDVTDTSGDYDNIYGAFRVQGSGSIPFFYFDSVYARNKVYGNPTPISPVVSCQPFVLDFISGEDSVCAAFDLDFIYSDTVTVYTVDIADYGDWGATGDSEIATTFGKINLTSLNPTITTTTNFAGESIGIIAVGGRPLFDQFINLGASQISVDTSGIIRYYGYENSVSGSGSEIVLTDVLYSLT